MGKIKLELAAEVTIWAAMILMIVLGCVQIKLKKVLLKGGWGSPGLVWVEKDDAPISYWLSTISYLLVGVGGIIRMVFGI
jgi:hypothetical protein